MDLAYGPIFFVAIVGSILITQTFEFLPILIASAIFLWSTRLSYRLVRKNWGKPEDPRYANWRQEWSKHGRWYFLLRSYLQISILQGLVILIVSLPGIIALSFPYAYSVTSVIIGGLIFVFGLTYETIADIQLDNFLARKKAGTERAVLMTSGLFKYSRRPNYFGETLVWWGMAIMVLPLPFGWLALLSPILITLVVTKATGPILEKIFLEKYPEEYSEYMRTTNYLIPGPKKQ
jgi:steroid 5-alpha reductase family enzyme